MVVFRSLHSFLYSQSFQSRNPCHLLSTFLNQHSFLPMFLKNRSIVPECYSSNSKLIHIQSKNIWSGLLPQWSQFSVLKFVLVTFPAAMIKSCKISLREERIILTHPFWVWCNMIEKSLFKKVEKNHTHT